MKSTVLELLPRAAGRAIDDRPYERNDGAEEKRYRVVPRRKNDMLGTMLELPVGAADKKRLPGWGALIFMC